MCHREKKNSSPNAMNTFHVSIFHKVVLEAGKSFACKYSHKLMHCWCACHRHTRDKSDNSRILFMHKFVLYASPRLPQIWWDDSCRHCHTMLFIFEWKCNQIIDLTPLWLIRERDGFVYFSNRIQNDWGDVHCYGYSFESRYPNMTWISNN